LAASVSSGARLYAALYERDPLKQFLFFFLAIERQTNASYVSLNSRTTLDTLACWNGE
jgi:hypothetical protein